MIYFDDFKDLTNVLVQLFRTYTLEEQSKTQNSLKKIVITRNPRVSFEFRNSSIPALK